MTNVETNTYLALPEIDPEDFLQANDHVASLYSNEGIPAFVARDAHRVGSERMNHAMASAVIDSAAHALNASLERVDEWGPQLLVNTPEHVDGPAAGVFSQVHTNRGPAKAEVLVHVRSLDRMAQSELAESLRSKQGAENYTFAALVKNMPASVFYAPIIARYRTFLNPHGDTVVFRNGFDGFSVADEPKLLTSHKFHSIYENGSPVEDITDRTRARNIDVSYLVPKVPRRRLGRRK